MKTAKKKTEQQEAIERLRSWIKPYDTLFTILRHCSNSGMSRVIDVVAIRGTRKKPDVSAYGYNIALALGWKFDRKREGIRIGGCGMDMGFHVVYELSSVLFGNGYKLNQRWL
jgi:hypothetical protein